METINERSSGRDECIILGQAMKPSQFFKGSWAHIPTAFPKKLEEALKHIAHCVQKAGGRALLVGGCVRDALLGLEAQDIDIEVFGLSPTKLESLLCTHFPLDHVGKAFGVLKIRNLPIDITLPRRESKSGTGHKGFLVEADPYLNFAEAAARRDFTVNAISWDPITAELIDPYNGLHDLTDGCLRHTSEKFGEDALRVLRAMQFAARFDFCVEPATVALCRRLECDDLPAERIFEEWKKLLLKGCRPSTGLAFLRECGWLRYYPELHALDGCRQDPEWHPEGDVWTHTLLCLDVFARERIGEEWEDLVVGFAILCHDFGKPATTFHAADGHIRSPGHAEKGVGLARSFLSRLTRHKALLDAVTPLVHHHMRPLELYKSRAGDAAIRRLSQKVGRIDRLIRIDSADRQGRGPMEIGESPQGRWLLKRAEALAVKDAAPQPIVQGRHLIALGETPGPHFKALLSECYEAQLDGRFADIDSGIDFVKGIL